MKYLFIITTAIIPLSCSTKSFKMDNNTSKKIKTEQGNKGNYSYFIYSLDNKQNFKYKLLETNASQTYLPSLMQRGLDKLSKGIDIFIPNSIKLLIQNFYFSKSDKLILVKPLRKNFIGNIKKSKLKLDIFNIQNSNISIGQISKCLYYNFVKIDEPEFEYMDNYIFGSKLDINNIPINYKCKHKTNKVNKMNLFENHRSRIIVKVSFGIEESCDLLYLRYLGYDGIVRLFLIMALTDSTKIKKILNQHVLCLPRESETGNIYPIGKNEYLIETKKDNYCNFIILYNFNPEIPKHINPLLFKLKLNTNYTLNFNETIDNISIFQVTNPAENEKIKFIKNNSNIKKKKRYNYRNNKNCCIIL
ncbi:MAG: hypothetical protein GY830_04800 [Bacteroidetes bacterium]|nr:hypothetical protein [Bacteroidota bacterium]